MNIEFLMAIAQNYRLDVKQVVAKEGGKLRAITKEVIDEVFMLNPNLDCPINPEELEREYKNNERLYREKLASFRPIGLKGDERPLTSKEVSPDNTSLFASYFTNTYYALCQVCGVDARSMIPHWMFVICMDIQDIDINGPFDYTSLVPDGLHKALYELKVKPSLNFRYYSLLLHIFLYKGLKVWHPNLNVSPILSGESLLL